MKKCLTDYDLFKVIRPLYINHNLDNFHFPIKKAVHINELDIENLKAVNFQNLKQNDFNNQKIVLSFLYDKVLNRLWLDPLKKIPLFKTVQAVVTPDFSAYSTMNYNDVRYNIYKNRWLGCLYQDYGIKTIPSIGWINSDTYEMCFSCVEKGGIVAISTLGCHCNPKEFLEGFRAMKEFLSPELIIVYGNMIDGMTGKFMNIKYEDAFSKNIKQPTLFFISNIFEIGESYGK